MAGGTPTGVKRRMKHIEQRLDRIEEQLGLDPLPKEQALSARERERQNGPHTGRLMDKLRTAAGED